MKGAGLTPTSWNIWSSMPRRYWVSSGRISGYSAHSASETTRLAASGWSRGSDLAHRDLQPVGQHLAGGGEFQAAAAGRTLEQTGADLLLQQADMAVYGGSCNVQLLRRFAERAGARHLLEIADGRSTEDTQ